MTVPEGEMTESSSSLPAVAAAQLEQLNKQLTEEQLNKQLIEEQRLRTVTQNENVRLRRDLKTLRALGRKLRENLAEREKEKEQLHIHLDR